MGSDKALILLAGRTLISHVLDRLEPQVEHVLISANGDPARFADLGCRVIADALPQGPLSGIHAALVLAGRLGATHAVSTPVDTPFLPGDLVPQLMLAAESSVGGLSFASDATGDHPATALWPVAIVPALADFLASGNAKTSQFTQAHQAARAQFSDPRAFQNLNTPDDIVAAEALLKGAA